MQLVTAIFTANSSKPLRAQCKTSFSAYEMSCGVMRVRWINRLAEAGCKRFASRDRIGAACSARPCRAALRDQPGVAARPGGYGCCSRFAIGACPAFRLDRQAPRPSPCATAAASARTFPCRRIGLFGARRVALHRQVPRARDQGRGAKRQQCLLGRIGFDYRTLELRVSAVGPRQRLGRARIPSDIAALARFGIGFDRIKGGDIAPKVAAAAAAVTVAPMARVRFCRFMQPFYHRLRTRPQRTRVRLSHFSVRVKVIARLAG
jgi:hypothetical protein